MGLARDVRAGSSRQPGVGWIWMIALVGCATPLGGGQPAHVVPYRDVRVSVAAEALVPTGTSVDAVESARILARTVPDGQRLTEMEQRRLLEAGVTLATIPPGLPARLDVAYGLWRNLEIDLRLASGAFFRLGGRYQVLHQDVSRFDLSLGFAVGRSARGVPLPSWLYVRIDDFQRWNFELPVTLGQHYDYLRWWVGPRLVYFRAHTAAALMLPGQALREASARAGGFFVGGQAGVVVGPRKIAVGVELTLAEAFGDADLRFLAVTTRVPLATFIVYPALLLVGEL